MAPCFPQRFPPRFNIHGSCTLLSWLLSVCVQCQGQGITEEGWTFLPGDGRGMDDEELSFFVVLVPLARFISIQRLDRWRRSWSSRRSSRRSSSEHEHGHGHEHEHGHGDIRKITMSTGAKKTRTRTRTRTSRGTSRSTSTSTNTSRKPSRSAINEAPTRTRDNVTMHDDELTKSPNSSTMSASL